jgi:hypothetical protein
MRKRLIKKKKKKSLLTAKLKGFSHLVLLIASHVLEDIYTREGGFGLKLINFSLLTFRRPYTCEL